MRFNSHKEIPIQVLNEILTIDKNTGLLYWNIRDVKYFDSKWNSKETNCKIWNSKFANKRAFNTKSTGYYHGSLFGMKIRAHIIVYAMVNGTWPEFTIDHINGNRLDNRPTNLRDVNHCHNIQNQYKALPSSKTGVRGVVQVPSGKYVAQLRAEGKRYNLGTYDTIALAEQAYLNGKALYQNCPVTTEHCEHGIKVS